jgi:hypothetical protein
VRPPAHPARLVQPTLRRRICVRPSSTSSMTSSRKSSYVKQKKMSLYSFLLHLQVKKKALMLGETESKLWEIFKLLHSWYIYNQTDYRQPFSRDQELLKIYNTDGR